MQEQAEEEDEEEEDVGWTRKHIPPTAKPLYPENTAALTPKNAPKQQNKTLRASSDGETTPFMSPCHEIHTFQAHSWHLNGTKIALQTVKSAAGSHSTVLTVFFLFPQLHRRELASLSL